MEDRHILQMYVPLVDFIADICGAGCEVVLHDVSNPEQSVIAIRNGQHSGRKIGSRLTDLARQIKSEKIYNGQDYLSNYQGYGRKNKFLSSTYYIKNDDRLIGMLCVNKNLSASTELTAAVNQLLSQYNLALPQEDTVTENLDESIPSMLHAMVQKTITEAGISAERMSRVEKVQLVHKMNAQGILMMKGAVSEIAGQLGISEPTVYRYLNKDLAEGK